MQMLSACMWAQDLSEKLRLNLCRPSQFLGTQVQPGFITYKNLRYNSIGIVSDIVVYSIYINSPQYDGGID
jgi:hypothetical protein